MKNPLNPKWLLVVNTLPVVALLVSMFSAYTFLKPSEVVIPWGIIVFALIALEASTLIGVFRKQGVTTRYALFSIIAYVAFMYWYCYAGHGIFSRGMASRGSEITLLHHLNLLLMPTVIYFLFALVSAFTRDDKPKRFWIGFAGTIFVPVAAYVFSQTILPLWEADADENFFRAFSILVIATTLAFFFFLLTSIYVLITAKSDAWKKRQWIWKIPITIIFPVLGLYFNTVGDGADANPNMFGDFSDKWFYILAIANGMLLCLPNPGNIRRRAALFVGRATGFAYTLYFVIVFLPFFPLSIFAILLAGFGFLMLTPLALFCIHVNQLATDVTFLRPHFRKHTIAALFAFGVCVIPLCVTVNYLRDKSVLNTAIEYVFDPDYSRQYDIDRHAVRKALDTMRAHKNRDNNFVLFNDTQPYLSAWYNRIVLGNLTLSDSKIAMMKNVFFGNAHLYRGMDTTTVKRNPGVKITDIKVTSEYSEKTRMWQSLVDLEITDVDDPSKFVTEYSSVFALPAGAWISDYYLYVGNVKEPGMLVEKKSAMWIYSQIRNQNRDPGILYYLTGNKIAFKVFPFVAREVRRTGIEFTHIEPVTLNIDGHEIALGTPGENPDPGIINADTATYISAKAKETLPRVQRKPYFHFLVDCSENAADLRDEFSARIEHVLSEHHFREYFLREHNTLADLTTIHFVDSYTRSISAVDNWQTHYAAQPFKGGFFLDRAVRSALVNSYESDTVAYPIFVVVTDNLPAAIIDKDFSDLQFTFPETDKFLCLGSNNTLRVHSLVDNPYVPLEQEFTPADFSRHVLEYISPDGTKSYVPDNGQPSVAINFPDSITQHIARYSNLTRQQPTSSLSLQGRWMHKLLHLQTANSDRLSLVLGSFAAGVMTPVTSYIVVETDAQREMLLKKQQRLLKSGNHVLDPGEIPQPMPEPSLALTAALLFLALRFAKKRRAKTGPTD